jgi:hypothetical protein
MFSIAWGGRNPKGVRTECSPKILGV